MIAHEKNSLFVALNRCSQGCNLRSLSLESEDGTICFMFYGSCGGPYRHVRGMEPFELTAKEKKLLESAVATQVSHKKLLAQEAEDFLSDYF